MTDDRRYRRLAGGLLAVLVVLVLATFGDYGMTADEPVQNRYGNRLVRWYATGGVDRSAVEQHDTYYYGGLFELLSQGAVRHSPLGLYETRHLLNGLFGLLGVAAAWWAGALLAGPLAGLLSALLLAATPLFYGHAFNNPKDIPFASLYALATAALLRLGPGPPPQEISRRWLRRLLLAGAAIGLAAAVRVAGLALVVFAAPLLLASPWLGRRSPPPQAPARRPWRELGLALAGLVLLTVAAWLVMLPFWPYAQLDPLRNPLRAFRAFSDFWQSMPVLYDGALRPAGEVSRFSMPWLFAITLPETYFVALALGLLQLPALARRQPPAADMLGPAKTPEASSFVPAVWLAALTVAPLAWAVVAHTPFYNGNRHLLFIVPGLAVLAGVSAARWLQAPRSRAWRLAGGLALALTFGCTVADMIQLHPYQAVYFNRLLGGGLRGAAGRYETDYWCASYREGIEWIVSHYPAAGARERVRVAGHSTLIQVKYDLEREDRRRRLFEAVTLHDDPHLVLATTATGDHERTPGRAVHVIRRQGVPLLYVFELRAAR